MALLNFIKSPYVNPFGDFMLPNNCACYLDMQETGSKLIDKSGRGNHGTNGGSTIKVVQAGLARSFDGIDDFIQIADSPKLRLTTGGTLAAWIYPKTQGENGAGRIFDKSTDFNVTNGYNFTLGGTSRLSCRINAGTATIATDNCFTLNVWQLAVATFASTGRHIYVNGVDVTSTGGTQTALPPDVAGVVAIGNVPYGADKTFDGYIGREWIFTRALPQVEIRYIFEMTAWQYGIAA